MSAAMTETQAFELARKLQGELQDADTYTKIEVSGTMAHDTFMVTCLDVHRPGRVLFFARVYDDHTEAELEEAWREDIAKARELLKGIAR